MEFIAPAVDLMAGFGQINKEKARY